MIYIKIDKRSASEYPLQWESLQNEFKKTYTLSLYPNIDLLKLVAELTKCFSRFKKKGFHVEKT